MRIVYSLLISIAALSNAYAAKAPVTLFQARGLIKNKCYQEIVGLTCPAKGPCMADLFPATAAKISITLLDVPDNARKTFGRIFQVNFQVTSETGDEARLQNWSAKSIDDLKGYIDRSTGRMTPKTCPVRR
jgi:hypothetical protein